MDEIRLEKLERENEGLKTLLTKLITLTNAPICEHEITDTINNSDNCSINTCNKCREYLCKECLPHITIKTFDRLNRVYYHLKCADVCGCSNCKETKIKCSRCNNLLCIECDPHPSSKNKNKNVMLCNKCVI